MPSREGVDEQLAMQMLVTGIRRVHGNSDITQHRLGTRGGNDNLLI